MTTKNKPPFRYDIVGSFLRPAALKEKREASVSIFKGVKYCFIHINCRHLCREEWTTACKNIDQIKNLKCPDQRKSSTYL